MAVFPLLGVGEFWYLKPSAGLRDSSSLAPSDSGAPSVSSTPGNLADASNGHNGILLEEKKPQIPGPCANSLFIPDEVIFPHARFHTLTRNIRQRRGEKVRIERPKLIDEFTNLAVNLMPPNGEYTNGNGRSSSNSQLTKQHLQMLGGPGENNKSSGSENATNGPNGGTLINSYVGNGVGNGVGGMSVISGSNFGGVDGVNGVERRGSLPKNMKRVPASVEEADQGKTVFFCELCFILNQSCQFGQMLLSASFVEVARGLVSFSWSFGRPKKTS